MRRRLLALCGLALLVFLAGCFGGGGEIPEDELTGEADYNWETDANASFTLQDSERFSFASETYAAVIDVQNQSSLEVFSVSTIQGESALQIEALQFRYRNGTVVNATHQNLTAVRGSDNTEIRLPADNGTVGYTTSREGKRWVTQRYVDGPHEVTLPPGGRVGIPLLSRTVPGGRETSVSDNRMTIQWEDPGTDRLVVRYYLVQDILLLGGIAGLAAIVALGGVLYYYQTIRKARQKREEVGLDVEVDDDEFGDDPPPGMR